MPTPEQEPVMAEAEQEPVMAEAEVITALQGVFIKNIGRMALCGE